jgi:hypothetical protein
MILLRSVFIIAIVAVAMIGVMVPSVFAKSASIDDYKNMEIIISDVKVIEQEYRDFISYTVTMRDSTLKVHEDYMIKPNVIRTYIDYNDGEGIIFGNDPKTFSGWDQEGEEGCKWLDDYHYLSGADGGIYSFKMCHYVESDGWDEMIIILKCNCYPGDSTLEKSRIIKTMTITETSSNGGGCLIATATYGSEMSQQVQQLRELRDNQLLQTESGKQFMGTFNDIYYSFSPTIADMEREHPMFKEAVKLAITPMISSLSLMENANSESEVLSMGISVIMLNLGMYLGVPAIVIVGIRKQF